MKRALLMLALAGCATTREIPEGYVAMPAREYVATQSALEQAARTIRLLLLKIEQLTAERNGS